MQIKGEMMKNKELKEEMFDGYHQKLNKIKVLTKNFEQ